MKDNVAVMRNAVCVLTMTLVGALALAQQGSGVRPAWAFPVADKDQPNVPESTEARHLTGSAKAYTPQQIDDLSNPPDWYPEEHGSVPQIVQKGKGAVLACGACHLMSGHGHPESADITGFSAEYITQQMMNFKSGDRKDTARMNAIAKDITDDDIKQSAAWFAALKPGVWIKVVEADMVPKSYVSSRGRMRLPHPEGGTEALGKRIIELPDDAFRATSRDPHSGFTAYVPKGSIAKGATLVSSGGCTGCHGDGLKGSGDFPRLAGLHPIYLVRQLSNFQSGANAASSAGLMKDIVASMTEDDMIAIAAYAASLAP
jgi:cytochrome c553